MPSSIQHPFGIRKQPAHDNYYVYNTVSKKRLTPPLPMDEALKKIRSLYANIGEEYREKKYHRNKVRYPAGDPETMERMKIVRAHKEAKKTGKEVEFELIEEIVEVEETDDESEN